MLAAFHNELNLILKNKFEFADHLAMDYKNGLVPDTNNVAAVTALLTMCTNLKEEFNKKIEAYDRRFQRTEKQLWSEERVEEVMNVIKAGKASRDLGLRQTSQEIFWMKRCDVVRKNKEDYLIFKSGSRKEKPIRIVPKEHFFDIVADAHQKSNHGGRHRVAIAIRKKYFIPKNVIRLYVSMCPGCQANRLLGKSNASLHPSGSQFNEKGIVNLINFKYFPDGEYKWLLSYQDVATKFINLRPLKTIMPAEVTSELMKIFLTFGAPKILQVDLESFFMLQVKQEITGMWPNCQVVPKSSSKLYECERQELEYVMHTWMTRNETTKWSVGCYFVQHNKNTSTIRALGNTPYKTAFGCEPRAELCVSSIPPHLLKENESNLIAKIKKEPKEDSSQKME